MTFLTESIAACLLFTLMLELVTRNRREAFANDYPPVVTEKLRVLGLIAQKPPAKKNGLFLFVITETAETENSILNSIR